MSGTTVHAQDVSAAVLTIGQEQAQGRKNLKSQIYTLQARTAEELT